MRRLPRTGLQYRWAPRVTALTARRDRTRGRPGTTSRSAVDELKAEARRRHGAGAHRLSELHGRMSGAFPFQADCAGSIPVTRSTAVSRDTVHGCPATLTQAAHAA